MLFILAMEVLNKLFLKASNDGLLHSSGHEAIKYRASFYADDVVIFVKPSASDLHVVKGILEVFGTASGLHTNLLLYGSQKNGCAFPVDIY